MEYQGPDKISPHASELMIALTTALRRADETSPRRFFKSDLGTEYPFLYLGAVVDTGDVKTKIGMGCPLIDETKL